MKGTSTPARDKPDRLPAPTELARRGVRNVGKMMAGRLAAQVILVASAIIVPALLGAESFGHYAAVIAVVSIVQSASNFGLNVVEIRFLAPLWRSGPRGKAIELGSTIWTTRILFGVAAGVAAALWFGASGDLVSGAVVWLALSLLAVMRSAFEATRSLFLPLDRVGSFVGLDLTRALTTLLVVPSVYLIADIDAVFIALPITAALLLALAVRLLTTALPLHPRHYSWNALSPHLGLSLSSFVATTSHTVQIQFSIYMVAVWVARAEAGALALTIQLFLLLQGIVQSARSSVMPILAELEAEGNRSRLRTWGGLMMRYGAAVACIACVTWALLGDLLLKMLLPSDFAAVHESATIILVAVSFFSCASSCNAILFIRRRGWHAASSCVVYLSITVGGVILAIGRGQAVVSGICWVYVISAVIFFALSYLLLGLGAKMWLPLRRTVLLLLPLGVAWPALASKGSVASSIVAAVGFIGMYLTMAALLRLLPPREIREILHAVRGSAGPRRTSIVS